MTHLLQLIALSAPLFAVVLIGYLLALTSRWRRSWTTLASKFVFTVALPALLFSMMSDLESLPPLDARLLIAFFGGCLIVFASARFFAARVLALDGVAQSVFALAGVFSNNVLLGLPLARVALGEAATPSIALVIVFNSLILWTLATVSVEWARRGSFTLKGFGKAALGVLTNPVILAIFAGTQVSFSGIALPGAVTAVIDGLAWFAAPGALLALGLGLAGYGVQRGLRESVAICALKLIVQPLVVWLLAAALGLPPIETSAVVLLASMSVGVNVFVMAAQFDALQGAVASSLVLSTALAAVTTPLWLLLLERLQ